MVSKEGIAINKRQVGILPFEKKHQRVSDDTRINVNAKVVENIANVRERLGSQKRNFIVLVIRIQGAGAVDTGRAMARESAVGPWLQYDIVDAGHVRHTGDFPLVSLLLRRRQRNGSQQSVSFRIIRVLQSYYKVFQPGNAAL